MSGLFFYFCNKLPRKLILADKTGVTSKIKNLNIPNFILQHFIFSESVIKSEKEVVFENTELGKVYKTLPIKELASLLPERKSGAKGWFDNEGQIALMFLKSYTGHSDEALIENINNNWVMQMFCGVQLSLFERIKDKGLASAIRCRLGQYLDLNLFQEICLKHWKEDIADHHVCMNDAVVYESYIKYPTDVKLLWDSVEWIFEKMFVLCEQMEIRKPRSKYCQHKDKQKVFAKKKKKSYKDNRRRIRQLLKLLSKGLDQLQEVINYYYQCSKSDPFIDKGLDGYFFDKLKTIKTIFTQQQYMLTHQGKKAPDRIVSLAKPWIRAIVRGKENKLVEFGPKIHMTQVGGINYIEHYSYKPFNECKRLKVSILKNERLFGKCSHYAADNIYPTNENRKFIRGKNIYTNFAQKGKVCAHEAEQLRSLRIQLGKQRATVLEGSFGNEKNHYTLNKIKAKLESTERIWVFFGVMTANAVKISKRAESRKVALKAA